MKDKRMYEEALILLSCFTACVVANYEDIDKLPNIPVANTFKDLKFIIDEYFKQEKALDKACEELGKMCKQTKCKDCHFVKEQVNEDNDCPVQGNIAYCDWKEWCLKDAE